MHIVHKVEAMKTLLLLIFTFVTFISRADWRTILAETHQETPLSAVITIDGNWQPDETLLPHLKHLFELERTASSEDAPYLQVYTALLLREAASEFRWDYSTKGQLPDLNTPVEQWTRQQVHALIQQRILHVLQNDTARFAHLPLAYFPGIPSRIPWPNPSVLSTLVAIALDYPEMKDPVFRQHLRNVVQDSGDLLLEGWLEAKWIAYDSKLNAERFDALEALLKRQQWPADIVAQVRLEQAYCLNKDEELAKKYWVLAEARTKATLHFIKTDAAEQINELRQAVANIPDLPAILHPEQRTLSLEYRNIQEITLTITTPDQTQVYKETLKLPAPKHPYAQATTQITLPKLPFGKYTLSLQAPPNFDDLRPVIESENFQVGTFSAAAIDRQAKGFLYVYDLLTGAPIAGAEIHDGDKVCVTGADGFAPYTFPKEDYRAPQYDILLKARGETLTVSSERLQRFSHSSNESETEVMLFTDRILYRPGEMVHWEILILDTNNPQQTFLPSKETTGKLTIIGESADGKTTTFRDESITTSATGTTAGELLLPKCFTGGLIFRWNDKNIDSLYISEFRLPTFEVTVKRQRVGESIASPLAFTITAKDMNHTPLSGATATWTFQANGDWKTTGTLTLDAKGVGNVAITLPDTKEFLPNKELSANFTAVVVNQNGERQEEKYDFYIPPYGYHFRTKVRPDDWLFEHQPFTIELKSERENATGKLLIRPHSITKNNEQPPLPPIQTHDFAIKQPLTLTLPTGEYNLEVQSGAVTNQLRTLTIWPTTRDLSALPSFRHKHGTLLVKDEDDDNAFAVGETLECYSALPGDAPCYWVVATHDSISHPVLMTSPFFQVPITEDLGQSFAIMAFTIHQGEVYHQDKTIQVKPSESLKIEATQFTEIARPGSEQSWEVTVDAPKAELIVTCYDTALDTLSEYEWELIEAQVPWHRRWNSASASSLFYNSSIYWRELLPDDYCKPQLQEVKLDPKAKYNLSNIYGMSRDAWGRKGNKIGLYGARAMEDNVVCEPAEVNDVTPLRPRKNFCTTALWVPQCQLKEGKAQFKFTLPDALTTWRLQVFAFTPDGRSGVLRKECTTTQEIMLKPYLPRTLRVGDRLTLNVRVENTTDTPCERTVTFNNAHPRTVKVPAHGAAIASWEVHIQDAGEYRFHFACDGDAIETLVNVTDGMVEIEDVYPLTLVDTTPTSVEVALPTEEVVVTERWDLHPGSAITEALKKQLDYPFGCAEQTFAKLYAACLLGDAAPTGAVEEHLAALLKLRDDKQHLWPWLPGGATDPMISSAICIGTARLYTLGKAPKALVDAVREAVTTSSQPLGFPTWAYCCALLNCWPEQVPTTLRLAEAYLAAQSAQERRLITIAAQRLGAEDVATQGLHDVLATMKSDATWGRWWPKKRHWWFWWESPIESHVLGWEVLRGAGRAEDARGAALWLLQHRRLNGWGSTRSTTDATYALLAEGLQDQPQAPLTRTEEAKEKARHYTFARTESGITFGSLTARYRLPLTEVPTPEVSKDTALALTRSLTPAQPKVGDTVTVILTLTAAQPMRYLHLTVPRPANTEAMRTLPFWDWQSRAYLLPNDAGCDIFIDQLPRGTTTLRYEWKVTHAGECATEPARVTLMYAPDFAARTDSLRLTTQPN